MTNDDHLIDGRPIFTQEDVSLGARLHRWRDCVNDVTDNRAGVATVAHAGGTAAPLDVSGFTLALVERSIAAVHTAAAATGPDTATGDHVAASAAWRALTRSWTDGIHLPGAAETSLNNATTDLVAGLRSFVGQATLGTADPADREALERFVRADLPALVTSHRDVVDDVIVRSGPFVAARRLARSMLEDTRPAPTHGAGLLRRLGVGGKAQTRATDLAQQLKNAEAALASAWGEATSAGWTAAELR